MVAKPNLAMARHGFARKMAKRPPNLLSAAGGALPQTRNLTTDNTDNTDKESTLNMVDSASQSVNRSIPHLTNSLLSVLSVLSVVEFLSVPARPVACNLWIYVHSWGVRLPHNHKMSVVDQPSPVR